MLDEKLETPQKKLSNSLSAPNFIENYSLLDDNLKLNYKYETLKIENNYSTKESIKSYQNSDLNKKNINIPNLKQFEYKEYLYEENDNYNELRIKNKNLKRLFEQANSQLLSCLKKQQEMEAKYENEKEEIIERLTRIQNNYELYANSHRKLQNFEEKFNEVTFKYKELFELNSKTNEKLKEYKNKINKLYKNIDDFIENNYDKDLINMLSFEFLLHLKNEINEQFNLFNNIKQRNNYNEILNDNNFKYYTSRYYNSDYSLLKNKNNYHNLFNINANKYLINKKKGNLINKNDDTKINNINNKKLKKIINDLNNKIK